VSVTELDIRGHRISATGVASLRDNVQMILDFPTPTDCQALNWFLGMTNFNRLFLPQALKQLTAALVGNPKVLTWQLTMSTSLAAARVTLVDPG
jgi:hypothetical protein